MQAGQELSHALFSLLATLRTHALQDLVADGVPRVPHGLPDDAYRRLFNGEPFDSVVALADAEEPPLALDTDAPTAAPLAEVPAVPAAPAEEAVEPPPRRPLRPPARHRAAAPGALPPPPGPPELATVLAAAALPAEPPVPPEPRPPEGHAALALATPRAAAEPERELQPPRPVPPLLPADAAAPAGDDEAYLDNILATQSWGVFKFSAKHTSIEARCPYH